MKDPLRWFRLYADVYRNPKVGRLSDKVFRLWISCLCLAAENSGKLPPDRDIAYHLRISNKSLDEGVVCLQNEGLVDRDEGVLVPHNWDSRQFKSDVSTPRVQEFRKRRVNVSETFLERPCNGDETARARDRAETEQRQSIAEQIHIQKQMREPLASDESKPSERFEEFWARYPRKQHKIQAGQAWVSVVTLSNEHLVFACLDRYLASDEVARGVIMNPEKWLMEQAADHWSGTWPAAHIGNDTKPRTNEELMERVRRIL